MVRCFPINVKNILKSGSLTFTCLAKEKQLVANNKWEDWSPFAHFNSMNDTSPLIIFKNNWKTLITQNEKVRWQWVTLPKSFPWRNVSYWIPIYKNRVMHSLEARFHLTNPPFIETHFFLYYSEIIPIHLVKSLANINFQRNFLILPFWLHLKCWTISDTKRTLSRIEQYSIKVDCSSEMHFRKVV